MKFAAVPILTLLFMIQTFSKWAVEISFTLNQKYISKNLCENRYRPRMHCNGHCIFMKKIAQDEKQDQRVPVSKTEPAPVILSSASSFASVEPPIWITVILFKEMAGCSKPSDRSLPVFRPPIV